MNKWVTNRLILVSITSTVLLSACTSDHVYNPDFHKSGSVWVKKQTPEPVSEPAPIPEPEPAMSVSEQNSLAIENLSNQGFETQETEQGVVVFLPPDIYFQGAKSNIDLEAREKIAQIASEVNKEYLVERFIDISGHTDSNGPEQLNLSLSKLRAEAAAEELVFSKVKKTRLKVQWFGETKPRKEEKNANGTIIRANQALNRRVEFTILNPE